MPGKKKFVAREHVYSGALERLPELMDITKKRLLQRIFDEIADDLVGGDKIVSIGPVTPSTGGDEYWGEDVKFFRQEGFVKDLVRCRDCIWWNEYPETSAERGYRVGICVHPTRGMSNEYGYCVDSDYCSDAERR